MISPELFVESLRAKGVSFFSGVPDSLLTDMCAYITDNVDPRDNIITANEGAAVGLSAGHYLATGEIPLVYMQNSGIGNAVNPLLSLADEKVYSIPIIVVVGWRGEPGVHDEPQHIKQGEVTLPLLEAMKIPYEILPEDENRAIEVMNKVVSACKKMCKPYAVIVRKGTFSPYVLRRKIYSSTSISREEAMKCVVDSVPTDSIVISTTGKLSRELYEYRHSKGQAHESDFLTVGSMGHASSIALGISLAKPNRKIFCFDGDGAFIMHMGAISNVGNLAPTNYIHIVFNNGAHESVGGQPTLGLDIDIPEIAKACGYKKSYTVSTIEEIKTKLKELLVTEGPSLLEIRVGINSRKDLGRPKTTPLENKVAFMKFINNG